MQLQEFADEDGRVLAPVKYFEASAEMMGIGAKVVEAMSTQLKLSVRASSISLRDIEKVLMQLALLPQRKGLDGFLWGWQVLIVSLALFRAVQPRLFERAIKGNILISEVEEFYGIRPEMLNRSNSQGRTYRHDAFIIRACWEFALTGPGPEGEVKQVSKGFDDFGTRSFEAIIPGIERDFFRFFEITEQP